MTKEEQRNGEREEGVEEKERGTVRERRGRQEKERGTEKEGEKEKARCKIRPKLNAEKRR